MISRRASIALVAWTGIAVGCGARVDEPTAEAVDAAPIDDTAPADAPEETDASTCPSGFGMCSDACVDLAHDPASCGSCDRACAEGEVCVDGTCELPCAADLTACGTSCFDLRWDPAHCGACDNACEPGLVCSEGACAVACGGGAVRCGDACAVLNVDPGNCGACGVACAKGATCVDGACACPTAKPDVCDATCVDTRTDPAHCGACGNTCANARCATAAIPDGSVPGAPLVTANDCVKAVEVALGPSHACARVKIGALEDVWCWGDGAKGQLGREFAKADPVPTPVERSDGPWALGPTANIVVGPTSAFTRIGSVGWTWGRYRDDVYPGIVRATPWALSKDTGVGSIGVGRDHVCWTPPVRGDVRCDGGAALGRGSPVPVEAPFVKAPSDWPSATHFRAWKVAAMADRTCALGDDSTDVRKAYCWGVDVAFGGAEPRKVSDREATDVAVGADHACFRDKTSGIWVCWGKNDKGQCGLDRVVYGDTVTAPTDTTWTSPSLAPGVGFTCGVDGGKVFCWGNNVDGQLGDGTTVSWSAAPREVFGLTGVVSVSASDAGACAVVGDGTVWCWGRQQKGRFAKLADGVYRKPVRVQF